MRRALFPLLALALGFPVGVAADAISFDEIPAGNNNRRVLTEEYAHMGVHFVTSDDGAVWTGMSGGDPGGWMLEGTNGTNFVGFNGRSYALTVMLDAAVDNFRVDVARSNGSGGVMGFELEGFRDGVLVDEAYVDLSAASVNEWFTAALSEPVDEVRWVGSGAQPFGVDNMQWGADEVVVVPVEVDVKPGSDDALNPFSKGVVPVVLYGAEDFMVEDVDPDSLAFGPAGAGLFAHKHPHVADLNEDGLADLFCHFPMPDTGIAMGDTEVCLSGATMDGVAFQGCDDVTTVPRSR